MGPLQSFGIEYGEVRGDWTPLITSVEYEKGQKILRKHDNEKSRRKKIFIYCEIYYG